MQQVLGVFKKVGLRVAGLNIQHDELITPDSEVRKHLGKHPQKLIYHFLMIALCKSIIIIIIIVSDEINKCKI